MLNPFGRLLAGLGSFFERSRARRCTRLAAERAIYQFSAHFVEFSALSKLWLSSGLPNFGLDRYLLCFLGRCCTRLTAESMLSRFSTYFVAFSALSQEFPPSGIGLKSMFFVALFWWGVICAQTPLGLARYPAVGNGSVKLQPEPLSVNAVRE